MLDNFPPSGIKKGEEFAWDQLTIGVTNYDINFVKTIVEDFWKIVVERLSEMKDVDIQDPTQEAWFHVRRANKPNQGEEVNYAPARIEILRLRRGYLEEEVKENIREIPKKYQGVICAGWWPLNFSSNRHDNAFLSFLQKLSILRTFSNIIYPKCLARISNEYDQCQFCREAYQIMRRNNQPWSEALAPWFKFMDETKMAQYNSHEYAHWFGHILSGWL